jgi:CheY-like chemotaxis protein
LDGLEASQRIRQELSPDAQPRIIAMTANVMDGDREQCLASGMDDYIGKPISLRDLVDALNQAQPKEGYPPAQATSASIPPSAIIDPAAIQRLRAMLGKRAGEMLPGLMDSFLMDAEQLQARARVALEASDTEELRRVAHTLKSNAANFGALKLAVYCQELETLAKCGTLGGALGLLSKIDAEYKRVRTVLKTLREELV